VELRHRFERDGHEIDDDQEDQQPVDDDGGAVADRALLEHLVDAAAPVPDPVVCHQRCRREIRPVTTLANPA
jgi:hypothetical protein